MTVLAPYILTLLIMISVAYGGYFFLKQKNSLALKQTSLRLQDLKSAIQETDKQIMKLEKALKANDLHQYALLAHQVLPSIEKIQLDALFLKNHMQAGLYKKIYLQTENLSKEIKQELQMLELPLFDTKQQGESLYIMEVAPEIAQSYHNIQRDHLEILSKMDTAANRAELLALHEINMNYFKEILQGYLQIKKSPKDYYRAEQRLNQAKKAIEQFDLVLDDSLRTLNENQLGNFEISLRRMNDKLAEQEQQVLENNKEVPSKE